MLAGAIRDIQSGLDKPNKVGRGEVSKGASSYLFLRLMTDVEIMFLPSKCGLPLIVRRLLVPAS